MRPVLPSTWNSRSGLWPERATTSNTFPSPQCFLQLGQRSGIFSPWRHHGPIVGMMMNFCGVALLLEGREFEYGQYVCILFLIKVKAQISNFSRNNWYIGFPHITKYVHFLLQGWICFGGAGKENLGRLGQWVFSYPRATSCARPCHSCTTYLPVLFSLSIICVMFSTFWL